MGDDGTDSVDSVSVKGRMKNNFFMTASEKRKLVLSNRTCLEAIPSIKGHEACAVGETNSGSECGEDSEPEKVKSRKIIRRKAISVRLHNANSSRLLNRKTEVSSPATGVSGKIEVGDMLPKKESDAGGSADESDLKIYAPSENSEFVEKQSRTSCKKNAFSIILKSKNDLTEESKELAIKRIESKNIQCPIPLFQPGMPRIGRRRRQNKKEKPQIETGGEGKDTGSKESESPNFEEMKRIVSPGFDDVETLDSENGLKGEITVLIDETSRVVQEESIKREAAAAESARPIRVRKLVNYSEALKPDGNSEPMQKKRKVGRDVSAKSVPWALKLNKKDVIHEVTKIRLNGKFDEIVIDQPKEDDCVLLGEIRPKQAVSAPESSKQTHPLFSKQRETANCNLVTATSSRPSFLLPLPPLHITQYSHMGDPPEPARNYFPLLKKMNEDFKICDASLNLFSKTYNTRHNPTLNVERFTELSSTGKSSITEGMQFLEDAELLMRKEGNSMDSLSRGKLFESARRRFQLVSEKINSEKFPKNCAWTEKYRPCLTNEVCGNSSSVSALKAWLDSWRQRICSGKTHSKQRPQKTNRVKMQAAKSAAESESDSEWVSDCSDSDSSDSENSLHSALLVTGPCGSGKTSAVYACAQELGFNILEVNSSDCRTGSFILNRFGEAMESQRLAKWQSDSNNDNIPNQTGPMDSFSLILFDEAETEFEEDRGFLSAVSVLAKSSKRPIILTSNSVSQNFPDVLLQNQIEFSAPSFEDIMASCSLVAACESLKVTPDSLANFIQSESKDLRQLIHSLQFWKVPLREPGPESDLLRLHQSIETEFWKCGKTCPVTETISEQISAAEAELSHGYQRQKIPAVEKNSAVSCEVKKTEFQAEKFSEQALNVTENVSLDDSSAERICGKEEGNLAVSGSEAEPLLEREGMETVKGGVEGPESECLGEGRGEDIQQVSGMGAEELAHKKIVDVENTCQSKGKKKRRQLGRKLGKKGSPLPAKCRGKLTTTGKKRDKSEIVSPLTLWTNFDTLKSNFQETSGKMPSDFVSEAPESSICGVQELWNALKTEKPLSGSVLGTEATNLEAAVQLSCQLSDSDWLSSRSKAMEHDEDLAEALLASKSRSSLTNLDCFGSQLSKDFRGLVLSVCCGNLQSSAGFKFSEQADSSGQLSPCHLSAPMEKSAANSEEILGQFCEESGLKGGAHSYESVGFISRMLKLDAMNVELKKISSRRGRFSAATPILRLIKSSDAFQEFFSNYSNFSFKK